VFPNADHFPVAALQLLPRHLIALAVTINLFLPEFDLRRGEPTMENTAMPKASINENSDSRFWKNEIGANSFSRLLFN
jgi:hypothetical protein